MTIIRDGNEIELTPQELSEAYYEFQHRMDIAEILDAVRTISGYRKEYNDLLEDDDLLDQVAYKYRKYADEVENSDGFWEDLNDAYSFVKGN